MEYHEKLWIPDKMVRVIDGIYAGFECVVVDESVTSDWFMIKSGVKQGSVMSGFLFLLCLDWVMRKATADKRRRIRWNFTTVLEDLHFADDIGILHYCHPSSMPYMERLGDWRRKQPEQVNTRNGKTLRTECASSREKMVWWMAKNWMTLRSLHTGELL